jgi:hypothetical protein
MRSLPTRSLPFLVIAVLVEFVFASGRKRRRTLVPQTPTDPS